MIEKVILDYLQNELEIPVYMEQDNYDHDRYIVMERTGAKLENYIKKGTFAIQSYAESLLECALLNTRVVEAMAKIVELDDVSSSKLNTFYNYTDTSKKKYRYQAVFDLVYYD